MKYYKTIILSILFLMLASWSARAEVVDKIIAVVNDEVITLKEFNEVLEPYLKRIDESYKGNDKGIVIKQTKDAVLQRLIDNLLIEYEAKKKGASIKDEEVMNVLKDMLTRQNIGMKD